uniref:SOSS complex subunit C n=1 Tax=Cyprinodon variegatus TaxID=28743 RepID=A0A3Q2D224_CYPVA
MAANPPGQGNESKTICLKVMFTAEADIPLSRPNMKEFRDSAELQHIAAQQRAALQHAHTHSSGFFITQDSSFGNLILPVIPRLEPQS